MLKFIKMQGLGNSYIYIDCISNSYVIDDAEQLAKFVSDYRFGIGADGLVLIEKSEIADIKMRIFNKDGSEAEMCGNGIRCAMKLAYERNIVDKDEITVETKAGIKKGKLVIFNGKVESVVVNMGMPMFDANRIPMISESNLLSINMGDEELELFCVSMGNPHAVILANDIDKVDIKKIGPYVENHYIFPEKTNVEFVQVIDKKHIKMRVWERGSNETWACGTGACAAHVACHERKLVDNEINVQLRGGELYTLWNNKGDVYMKGKAEFICEGELEYDIN